VDGLDTFGTDGGSQCSAISQSGKNLVTPPKRSNSPQGTEKQRIESKRLTSRGERTDGMTDAPAAKRRKNAAHGASRGWTNTFDEKAPKGAKEKLSC
jgi:hypothetical protein